MSRPISIENRWDILYRDYPDVYEAFSSFPQTPDIIDVISEEFDLRGKTIADIGSGTGKSTFKLAKYAEQVIGIEPEQAMLKLAEQKAQESNLPNIELKKGGRESIPLPDGAVDVVTAITAGVDVKEYLRVLKPGGLILSVDIPFGWYGGELDSVIGEKTPELDKGSKELIEKYGFSFKDFDTVQDYGNLDNITSTYGFIFGQKVIDYLKKTGKTTIHWKYRVHYKYKK